MINSNLVFGPDSYLIRYMTQSTLAGSIPSSIKQANFKYNPLHSDDCGAAIEKALSSFSDVKSQTFALGGSKDYRLVDILNVLEEAAGKSVGGTSGKGNLGLSDLVEEFWVGIAHDKNMGRMADFFDKN